MSDNSSRINELTRMEKEITKHKLANKFKRIPVTGGNRLTALKRKGYESRWCNDEGSNLKDFLDGGWEFRKSGTDINQPHVNVTSTPGTLMTRSVGLGITGYLMDIPEALYKEDADKQQLKIKEQEDGMRNDPVGAIGGGTSLSAEDKGSFYGSVSIEEEG